MELSLARPIAGQIYAARSGHGDFAIYHERFNHTNAHLFCSCGELKSSRHLLQCRKPLIKLPKTPKSCRDAARYFLGTNAGAVKLAKWLSDTKYFAEICPRNLWKIYFFFKKKPLTNLEITLPSSGWYEYWPTNQVVAFLSSFVKSVGLFSTC